MSPEEQFAEEVRSNIIGLGNDRDLQGLSNIWIREITRHKYAYNFRWMGRPAIQFPQDQIALQELIWRIKPDLILETGIAHGGSLIFSASLLSLLDISDAIHRGEVFDPRQSNRKVLGIDIDIRAHNRAAIEQHPMSTRIQMIEGCSVSPEIISQVHKIAEKYRVVLVCLDSNHTHEHVLAELEAYAPLTSVGSYCVVFDTVIEGMPSEFFPDRPWGLGNNPKTAVQTFLEYHTEFEIDKDIPHKLLITVAPDGYLARVR